MKAFFAVGLLAIPALFHSSIVLAETRIVNGASFDGSQPIAPGSFATAFGDNLCANTASGDWIAPGQLPTTIAGCSVMVNGIPAMMQYVSPGQVNFIMPASLNAGQANFVVANGTHAVNATATVGAAGPGMFSLNGMGMGEGAMLNGRNWSLGPFSTDTNGQSTYLALYVTGLDLSTKPTVIVAGMPVDVMWYGNAPGYAGLQQINVSLPSSTAGAGRVPVAVTSNGQTSNITFMHVLPTTTMMQGMPGWGQGMMVSENMARPHEMSSLAFNPSNNTALVTDENDDAVRVISLASNSTIATIALPAGSQAHAIAVNSAGTLAAVTLSGNAAVALLDLTSNKVAAVVGTSYYPSRAAFAGSNVLVTNAHSGTVSVVDTSTATVIQTVNVGLGATGIAVAGSKAIIANMQAGSLSVINLSNYSVTLIALPPGTRPHEVAISESAGKAIVTTPMSNGYVILDLATNAATLEGAGTWTGMGPRAVAVNGSTAYIANQMSASVNAVDLNSGAIVKTFSVDPGPVALAYSASNRLLALCEGTGTLDVVDLGSFAVTSRLNAGDTERNGVFNMPRILSLSPASAAAGTTFTLTIQGSGFQGVQSATFSISGSNGGGGMMPGGMGTGMGNGSAQSDPNIRVSNLQINADGTQITATVEVQAAAAAGSRQIRLQTTYGQVMGMNWGALFAVTK